MSKYINADKFIEIIRSSTSPSGAEWIVNKVNEQPDIVRCENCQYCKHLKDIDKYYCERNFSRFQTSPDGFCDKGAEV